MKQGKRVSGKKMTAGTAGKRKSRETWRTVKKCGRENEREKVCAGTRNMVRAGREKN